MKLTATAILYLMIVLTLSWSSVGSSTAHYHQQQAALQAAMPHVDNDPHSCCNTQLKTQPVNQHHKSQDNPSGFHRYPCCDPDNCQCDHNIPVQALVENKTNHFGHPAIDQAVAFDQFGCEQTVLPTVPPPEVWS